MGGVVRGDTVVVVVVDVVVVVIIKPDPRTRLQRDQVDLTRNCGWSCW